MISLLLAGSPCAAEEAVPDGLLEFLGTMVESNGEWVDPLNLATPVERILLEEVRRDEDGTRRPDTEQAGREEHGDG